MVTVFFILQRGNVNQNLSQGHLSLSGFQLRGHAMFSGLDRPPDCETLEYAWLVEIQLGILSGRLTMPQVHHVMLSISNRPYSYSRYWTGTSFQLRLMRGIFSNANHMKLFLIIFPRISLHCKLVPVQYREYEYGLLSPTQRFSFFLNNIAA